MHHVTHKRQRSYIDRIKIQSTSCPLGPVFFIKVTGTTRVSPTGISREFTEEYKDYYKIKFGLFDGLEDIAEEAGYLCGVDVELQYERQG